MFEISELKAKTLADLQVIAKSIGLSKISQLKKLDLVYQILDVQAANPTKVGTSEKSNTSKPSKPKRKRVSKNPQAETIGEKPKEKEVVKTRTDSLIANWLITGYEIESGTMGKTDGFDDLDNCDKDDILKIARDNKIIWNFGKETCDSTDLTDDYGTWKLTTNDTRVYIEDNTTKETFDYKIITLTGTSLVLEYLEKYAGEEFTITETYTKQ